MALLKTLEGVDDTQTTGDYLDDLFNTNDVLGCMIYGPAGWNAVKSFACNRALELLANRSGMAANLRKIAGRKNYVVTNDVLDKTFGFNHCIGVELLGAEEWGEFVNECKLYEPDELGGLLSSIGKGFKSLLNPVGTVVPSSFTPGGLLQFAVAPGLTNVSDAFAAIGAKTETQKAAEAQAAEAEQARIAAEQYAAQQVEQAKQAYNTAYAQSRAQADADAAAAANLQYQLQLSPEYQQGQTNKIIILGGLGLLAITLLTRSRK